MSYRFLEEMANIIQIVIVLQVLSVSLFGQQIMKIDSSPPPLPPEAGLHQKNLNTQIEYQNKRQRENVLLLGQEIENCCEQHNQERLFLILIIGKDGFVESREIKNYSSEIKIASIDTTLLKCVEKRLHNIQYFIGSATNRMSSRLTNPGIRIQYNLPLNFHQ